MSNLNQILIEGNLVRDPELKHTTSGKAVCNFSVASNRSRKKGDELEKVVTYVDITTWEDLAHSCAQNLKKGRGVRVIGRLDQDRWQDNTGKTRTRLYVTADHVIFKSEAPKRSDEHGEEAAF